MTTRKTATAITSAVVYHATDRKTAESLYLVQSDKERTTFYEVRWSDEATAWQCNCPARHDCKHLRAVREVQAARRSAILDKIEQRQAERDNEQVRAEVAASTIAAAEQVLRDTSVLNASSRTFATVGGRSVPLR